MIDQMKIPIIDQRFHDKAKFNTSEAITTVLFEFDEEESVIRGFLTLAEYFHTIVIREGDEFIIPHDFILFRLVCG